MKIAIVDKFYRNHNAFSRQLKFSGHEVHYLDNVRDLSPYDLIHFDWCDDLAVAGTQQFGGDKFRGPRITIRLHAYEAHEGWIHHINWNSVDTVILVSQHYLDIFNDKVKHPVSRCVVNHGVDLNRYRYTPHSGNDVLYVGSINFKKGPQLLGQVALAIPNNIDVYGDIQCERSQLYFNHLRLSNLRFLPHNSEIHKIMMSHQYRYILSTSLGESFHLAIAEGMACGLYPLVHDWMGASELWPVTWRSIDDLKKLIQNHPISGLKCRKWVEERYDSKVQTTKLEAIILGDTMKNLVNITTPPDPTIAACMITRSNYEGLVRALKSCYQYIDAAYVAVDSRDEDDTVNKVPKLLEELGLKGAVKSFEAPEPWDFSYARNIAHRMNQCDFALVIDDDEYVMHPDEIPEILRKHRNIDVIDVTCGMGVDEYGNVSDTWKFTRLMKKHVKWINPRHNIPDSSTVSSSVIWKGDLVVVDDKSIKKTPRRAARNKQRESNVDEFRKKIDENPNDTRSLFYLAVAYRESFKYWEAIHWYQQYVKTGGWDEERWQAYYDMALCQIALRRYTEARESVFNAIKEKYDRAEAFILMGDIFYTCESFYDAMIWYELGCSLPFPEDARLFVQKNIYDWERYDKLSMTYNHLGNWGKAVENAEKVLKKRPNDKRVINNIKVWKEQHNGNTTQENVKA